MSSESAHSETTPLRRLENNIVSGTRISVNNNNNIQLLDTRGQRRMVPPKMDINTRILIKICIDVTILLTVGFPILFFYLWGDPYKRGFFCDDESLRHPFHESTVRNWMLYIIGIVLPIAIILATEIVKANLRANSAVTRDLKILDWDIPPWVVGAYKQIGVFGFGAAASQLATDIAKYSIGRLRPHFINVCQPVMPDGSNCSSLTNIGRYIEKFECLGVNSTPRMLKEMRLSFPSGHSSFSTYTMIYCAIYLNSRMSWRGSKLLKHFLQFLLIMLAWFTSLSRVSDYKHHWSDVLAGSAIGAAFALVVANYVSDLCDGRNRKSYLPSTRQELTTSSTTTNGHA